MVILCIVYTVGGTVSYYHYVYIQVTVDTLLPSSQPGVVHKEWDPLPSLPEPLVPAKCKDPGSTGGTSVMKRDSSERGLSRRKRTLSACIHSTPAHVTKNKVPIDVTKTWFFSH